MKPATFFDSWWCRFARRLLRMQEQEDRRTGEGFRSLGMPLVLETKSSLPLLTVRKLDLKWFATETVWFLSGCSDPGLMESMGFRAWSKFPRSMLYGPRWRGRTRKGDTDQLAAVADRLTKDPTAKGAVLLTARPDDVTGAHAPCFTAAHFSIMRGALHMSVLQRSCDFWFGAPADVAMFAAIRNMLAARLGVSHGYLTVLFGNAHLYSNQEAAVEKALSEMDSRVGGCPDFVYDASDFSSHWQRSLDGDKTVVFEIVQSLADKYEKMAGPEVRPPRLIV